MLSANKILTTQSYHIGLISAAYVFNKTSMECEKKNANGTHLKPVSGPQIWQKYWMIPKRIVPIPTAIMDVMTHFFNIN
jgi:hypothetical protein